MMSSCLSVAPSDSIEAKAGTHSQQYHPLPNLLELSAVDILEHYRRAQCADFMGTLAQMSTAGSDLTARIELLSSMPGGAIREQLRANTLEKLFKRMHEHVMSHPVWVHPTFDRITEGQLNWDQLTAFSKQYFNQVKNTRQCVALALGRFHSFVGGLDGATNSALSELTQIVLAGLLCDEYGMTGSHSHGRPEDNEDECAQAVVDIGRLFSPVTHPALFRRFLKSIGVAPGDYDVPMLHAVADNVLVQRLLSSHEDFDELEALASVGLGMEWGVPAFFSMIIAGILKAARREGKGIDPWSMELWSAHVHQDVEHAISVMVATSFYAANEEDYRRIEGATNVLMASRYDMMSELHSEIFGEPCPTIADIALDPRYALHDRRIETLLEHERKKVAPKAVRNHAAYAGLRKRFPIRANINPTDSLRV